MVTIPHIWRQSLHITLPMRPNLPITQERKAVLVSISDVVVFESWIFDRFEEVDGLLMIQK